jgi:hypothetical protein
MFLENQLIEFYLELIFWWTKASQTVKDFVNEVATIGRIHHANVTHWFLCGRVKIGNTLIE